MGALSPGPFPTGTTPAQLQPSPDIQVPPWSPAAPHRAPTPTPRPPCWRRGRAQGQTQLFPPRRGDSARRGLQTEPKAQWGERGHRAGMGQEAGPGEPSRAGTGEPSSGRQVPRRTGSAPASPAAQHDDAARLGVDLAVVTVRPDSYQEARILLPLRFGGDGLPDNLQTGQTATGHGQQMS